MLSKKDKKFLVVVFVIFPLIMFIFWQLIFINAGITCAKAIRKSNTKGSDYIHYSYLVNGEAYSAHKSISYFRITDLDELKELGCFKIEYSKIFPSFTRIIDERVKR